MLAPNLLIISSQQNAVGCCGEAFDDPVPTANGSIAVMTTEDVLQDVLALFIHNND